MMFDVEIDGIDDLIKELENLERATEEAKDDALISGGELLKNKIKSEVYSHGLHRRTGQAQESIVRTDPKDGELFVGTQGGAKRPGFYLYMHEFGYYNVKAKRFIAPKPLVSVVYENSKNEILEAYAKVFRRRWGM